eukprot:8386440-Pyramimonas_sp.AAC.1
MTPKRICPTALTLHQGGGGNQMTPQRIRPAALTLHPPGMGGGNRHDSSVHCHSLAIAHIAIQLNCTLSSAEWL